MYAYCGGSPGTFGLSVVKPGAPSAFDDAARSVEAQIATAGAAEAQWLRQTFQPGQAVKPTIAWTPLVAAGVFALALVWVGRKRR